MKAKIFPKPIILRSARLLKKHKMRKIIKFQNLEIGDLQQQPDTFYFFLFASIKLPSNSPSFGNKFPQFSPCL